ncbi:MAG TPA: DUF5679 domain-containing protein [Herpetosiphonaceae bacterium]
MNKDRRKRRSWLLGLLTGIVAVVYILRRRLEPVDSAPLLPSPTPPPPPEPPRIVLPASIVESADGVPEEAPAEEEPIEEPALEAETEAPLLEREVGGATQAYQPPAAEAKSIGAEPAAEAVPAADEPTATEEPAEPEAVEETPAAEHDHDDPDEQTGYCVSCRAKRTIVDGHEETTENGRRAVRGTCPVCGNTIFRFLPNKD